MRRSHNTEKQAMVKEGTGGTNLRSEKKEMTAETKKLERQTTEDINASAEAFIKNFRQHLLIQRLQSMENYEQMLAKGL